jgi:hypothetical protein
MINKRLILILQIMLGVSTANAFEMSDAPPIFCISKHGKCLARVFGSVHMAPKSTVAVTKLLLEEVDKTEHFFFEIAPGAVQKVNAIDLVSESKFREARLDVLTKNYKSQEIFDEELASATVKFLSTSDMSDLLPLTYQVADQKCGMSRLNGSEEIIGQRIAGKNKFIYSIESDATRSVDMQLPKTDSKIERSKQQEISTPIKTSTKKPSVSDMNTIYKMTCDSLQTGYSDWLKSGQFYSSKLNQDHHTIFATEKRNKRIVSFSIDGIKKSMYPMIVVGYQHLYGTDGVLKLFEKNGYIVSPLLNK